MKDNRENLYKSLPDSPGVYLMHDAKGEILYIGKAGNLKRRVSSYFLRPHDTRIERLVSKIKKIDHRTTDSAIEALILEAELIKKIEPSFNIKEKDDKSFLYVDITKEKFSRVLLARGRDMGRQEYVILRRFGPFTSASSLREALKLIRRILPFNVHPPERIDTSRRPCFDHEVGLCPGTCANKITSTDYKKNVKNIILFFEGKKEMIITRLAKEMQKVARSLDFEKAEKIKRQIFSLKHIHDVAFITEDKIADSEPEEVRPERIEGYDISNISGVSAVGSMVVFSAGKPSKDEYRKFKIKTIDGANDVGMLREVLERRFSHVDEKWPLPDLVLVDGGITQVNTARSVLGERGIKIPIVGIVKGPERKRNDIIGIIPRGLKVDLKVLIKVRDEAHRFAISYHKNLRNKNFFT